ncbi:MAG: hypothetical protein GKS06_07330 [Acidobacteria bacterium]|nr:hypothetical protein [Acidobacteriota bacterium]
MAKWHLGWDNWFLVIPAALLGVAALITINQMYRAGDIRRSIEVVTTYEVQGQPMLGDFMESREGQVDCAAEMISRFYGTLDVSCASRESGLTFTWRVHVGQRAFAPADDLTLALMRDYAPGVFGDSTDTGADEVSE